MTARTVRLILVGALIGLLTACGPAATTGSPAAPGSPSGAKELEAMLPNEMCGSTAIKFSMSGDQFGQDVDQEFKDTLQTLGKSPSDVSFAAAGSTDGKCGAGIFRVNGVEQARLQEVFLNASKSEGGSFAPASVGGRSVFVVTSSGDAAKQWVYFKDDAALFVTADDEAKAATILQAMP
jgi:hypothetical protein